MDFARDHRSRQPDCRFPFAQDRRHGHTSGNLAQCSDVHFSAASFSSFAISISLAVLLLFHSQPAICQSGDQYRVGLHAADLVYSKMAVAMVERIRFCGGSHRLLTSVLVRSSVLVQEPRVPLSLMRTNLTFAR